jgi:uncharacterized protein (TIGR02270 family)
MRPRHGDSAGRQEEQAPWRGFSPREISETIHLEVLDTHASEAAFLWTQRNRAVRAPHYSLLDLSRLDARVEAHLDGLRTAGSKGWEVCARALNDEGPGEVFTAGVLAFGHYEAHAGAVLEVAGASAGLERPLVSALGWLPFATGESALCNLLRSDAPGLRRFGLAGYALHRQDPGPELLRSLGSADERLLARALRTVGELGRVDLSGHVLGALAHPDEECRFFAAWSAARLGRRTQAVLDTLWRFVDEATPYAERALPMLLCCSGLSGATAWLQSLKARPERHRLAVLSLGLLGAPEVIDELLAFMSVEPLSRVAGEAFSCITGVDLAYEDMERAAPPALSSVHGVDEASTDEELQEDPDEDLPWPEPSLVAAWWSANRGRFLKGRRYLMGMEVTKQSLRDILRHRRQRQRQRARAALHLAVLQPDAPSTEVRAPGFVQLRAEAPWTS